MKRKETEAVSQPIPREQITVRVRRRLLTILPVRVVQKISNDGGGRTQACRSVRFLTSEVPETTEVFFQVQIKFSWFKAFNFLEGFSAHTYNNIALRELKHPLATTTAI